MGWLHPKERMIKGELFESIKSCGLDQGAFDVDEEVVEDGFFKELKISYKPNQNFRFHFTTSPYCRVTWTPSLDDWSESEIIDDSSRLIDYFPKWLGSIKQDEDTPDLWAEFLKNRPPLSFQIAIDAPSESFSPAEIEQIKDRLKVLESRMPEDLRLEQPETEFVHVEISYLSEKIESEDITKKDFKLLFLATMMNIITTLVLDPAKASALWQLAEEVMTKIAGFLPPIA